MSISVVDSSLCHPTASFPSSMVHSNRFSKRISGNGNWVRERRRLYVKSSNSEGKKEEAAQKSSSNNTSSFLSFLCPLLKVFSVSASFFRNFEFLIGSCYLKLYAVVFSSSVYCSFLCSMLFL